MVWHNQFQFAVCHTVVHVVSGVDTTRFSLAVLWKCHSRSCADTFTPFFPFSFLLFLFLLSKPPRWPCSYRSQLLISKDAVSRKPDCFQHFDFRRKKDMKEERKSCDFYPLFSLRCAPWDSPWPQCKALFTWRQHWFETTIAKNTFAQNVVSVYTEMLKVTGKKKKKNVVPLLGLVWCHRLSVQEVNHLKHPCLKK